MKSTTAYVPGWLWPAKAGAVPTSTEAATAQPIIQPHTPASEPSRPANLLKHILPGLVQPCANVYITIEDHNGPYPPQHLPPHHLQSDCLRALPVLAAKGSRGSPCPMIRCSTAIL